MRLSRIDACQNVRGKHWRSFAEFTSRVAPAIGICFLMLGTGVISAQEERSAGAEGSASARYWTLPRVQPEPPIQSIEGSRAAQRSAVDLSPLEISNETLAVRWASNRLAFRFVSTGRVFLTDGRFN